MKIYWRSFLGEKIMITIDTSIFVDLVFEYDSIRILKAEKVLKIILERFGNYKSHSI